MPIRILYVHGETVIGGAERTLLHTVTGLDRNQFAPIVICPSQGPLVKELNAQRVPMASLPLPAWRKIKSFPYLLPSVYSLFRFLVRERIQLVHSNDMWWVPQTSLASQLARIPCLAHIRQELESKRVRQYRLKSPQMLIAVSKKVKQQLEDGGVMGNRVRVVYDAIDLGQCDSSINPQVVRETYGIQLGEPVIGTVAHLFPRKGYEFLISAMVEVRRAVPDVRWLVIGKGDPHYTAKLTDLIAKNGLEGLTRFLGYQTDIFPFLHAMDCVVLPSIMEGFGFVLVEAMAVGKPVIASRVGGIPEIVEDGVTGILVDPRDSRSLAKQIVLLLQDPQRRLTMGRAGKRRVQEHFTRKRMNEQLCEVYGELLEGAKKA